jgi:DNA repair protein RecO (recombination protein O)
VRNSYGLYIIELVNQFTAEHVEDKALFDLLLDTLHRLCGEYDKELLLRYFELHLLTEVGYRPRLEQCVSCQTSLKKNHGYFCPSAGGILCPRCSHYQSFSYQVSVSGLEVLGLLQRSIEPPGLNISQDLSAELSRVMRRYIKYLLDREVKSAAWLDSLKHQVGRGLPNLL